MKLTNCKGCGKKVYGYGYCSQECFEGTDYNEIEQQGFNVPDVYK